MENRNEIMGRWRQIRRKLDIILFCETNNINDNLTDSTTLTIMYMAVSIVINILLPFLKSPLLKVILNVCLDFPMFSPGPLLRRGVHTGPNTTAKAAS